MKIRHLLIAAATTASLVSLPAAAQSQPGAGAAVVGASGTFATFAPLIVLGGIAAGGFAAASDSATPTATATGTRR